jgi:DNA-binding Lrp family transcriptional regulator
MRIKEGPLSGYPIIRHFEHLPRPITIRQLSAKINLSYGWTNKHVHDLAKKGVLLTEHIGPSITVTPNLKNNLCVALLCVVASERAADPLIKQMNELATDAHLASAQTILYKDGNLTAITHYEGTMTVRGVEVHLTTAITPSMSDAIPLRGAEYFYTHRSQP